MVSGLSADVTTTVAGAPTGTEAEAGSTPMGGIVGVAVAAGTEVDGDAGVDDIAGEGDADGVGEASGAAATAHIPAMPVRRSTRIRLLRNLCFGVAHGRGEQRLIPDAGEEHGHQIALRSFDGSRAELSV